MDKMLNKFLLNGDKFMPKLPLTQPRFTYSACGQLIKHREKIQKFRETGNLACFTHDATYSDNEDFAKRTISNKIFNDRDHEIADMMDIKEH